MFNRKTFNRKTIWVSLLLAGSLSVKAVAADDQAEVTYRLDIQAQPLSSALQQLSDTTGLEVLFFTEVVEGITVGRLNGEYTPGEALEFLLAGTNLTTVYLEQNGAVAIRKKQDGSQGDQEKNLESEKDIEEMVVIGSHIRRPVESGPSPMLIFSKAEIDRTGYASTDQFIQRLPQNFSGGASVNNGNLGADGVSSFGGSAVNLRGLGSDSTLTLLNGHRLAPAGDGTFIDISMIPLSAIERIDVLTDGASAIYGSDAVGGVVNFILRDDYDGAETRLRYGSVTDGGRDEVTLGQTFGTTWDSGHALLSYEYMDQSRLAASDRGFTTGLNEPYDLLPEHKRHSVFFNGSQQLTETIDLRGDLFFSRRDTESFQATATSGLGRPDRSENTLRQYGATLEMTIGLSDSWRASLSGSYSDSHLTGISRYLDDGAIAGANTGIRDRQSTTLSVDAVADGSLFEMPGGDVQAAIGAHYRRETFENPRTLIQSGVEVNENRNVNAFFGELLIPFIGESNRVTGVERLELTLAGRYEDYSDFGSTTDPKVGLLWSPTESLKFRGTWSTSFRAPVFVELVEVNNVALLMNIADPNSPTGRSLALIVEGQNPDLQPETATTWTVGFDFESQSVPGLMVGLTYFNIDFEDRIERPGIRFDAFTNLLAESLLVQNPTAEDIQQAISGPGGLLNFTPFEFPGLNCCTPAADLNDPLTIVDGRLRNNAISVTKGFDFIFSYDLNTDAGLWNFSANGTYLTENLRQFSPNAPGADILGTVGNPVDLKMISSVSWRKDALSTVVFVNYVDSYENDKANPNERVSSWTTVDFNAGYQLEDMGGGFFDNTLISFNVINLFDRDPPFVSDVAGFVPGQFFDPNNATALGRFVSLTVTKQW